MIAAASNGLLLVPVVASVGSFVSMLRHATARFTPFDHTTRYGHHMNARAGSHRAVDDATSEATAAAIEILDDVPIHPDLATWDDAVTGRLDTRANLDETVRTPLGTLLLEVARLAAQARRCAERSRDYRAEADALEEQAAQAAHRLSTYRAAVEALTDPMEDQP